jgi:hypothetical protein
VLNAPLRHYHKRFDLRCPPPAASRRRGTLRRRTPSCFIVKDNNGQTLAYVCFESDAGRRTAANLLTRDEARRVAVNIAKLPDLLCERTK